MTLRVPLAAAALAVVGFLFAPPAPDPIEGARLNNLGAAYMNQQNFEKGLKYFQDAAANDPKLLIAPLNQGIALQSLGKVDAAKPLLEAAVKALPDDPNAWYTLGLLYKNTSESAAAVDAFKHVTAIDPNDANTWYFLGASYAQLKQFPEAIDAFEHALKLDPLHASAEFGISRAYQQSGDTAHAREHLVKFQHITQNKLGAAMGLAYGDQGEYSLAEESPAAMAKALPELPVKFVAVTEAARIATKGAGNSARDVASSIGPGACFLDFDGDGNVDLFLPDNGAQGGMSLYHNLGNGKFEDVTKKAGLDPSAHGIGCTAGDYDNDGWVDLVVSTKDRIYLLHNEKNGTFKDATETAGIKARPLNYGLTFVDYDHDGDLDLYVTVGSYNPADPMTENPVSGSVMWRNNGNGTFTDMSGLLGLDNRGDGLAAIGSDFNNDRAVDLIVGEAIFPPRVYENPREGKFVPVESWPKNSGIALGLAVADFNHDGWMDLASTRISQVFTPAVALWRNNYGKGWDNVPLPETKWVRGFGVAAIDYDNDGWVDLVVAGETAEGKGEVRLFRNLGPDGFKDVTADIGLDKIAFKNPRAVLTADYDNDGATDLLITQNNGPAILLRNEGGNKNNWMRLTFKGLADNKSAIGTKIEVFSGANRQKFEIAGSSGYLGQNSTTFVVGLGKEKEADIVRMLWPTGVLQDEIQVAGLKDQNYTEMDRRGSSCPTLFVWDGKRYQLVGDMLGDGVVGHWVGPNERNIPRPMEYIKIDRSAIKLKDGKLSFRFMEPLEEVVYLDQVKLLAVDHPSEYEVFPNEYFASNPPYPPFKVVVSRDARPPAGAWDEHRHDVMPDLRAHRYFGDFATEPFQGFAKMHTLELDLGQPYDGGALWLLMHGEVEYFSATSMYAASQAGLEAVAPYVEALGADGKWSRVVDDMGFPAGGPRTMTADLTDKLPKGTQRVRITTNLQIYWNSILINRTEQTQDVHLTPVPLADADLAFHGFPLKVEGTPPGNVDYIYENVSATGPYTRPAGAYTRFGDVRPLLLTPDDRFAVFGSGDEIALDFNPAKLPPLPKGWTRDYFFLANGYEKDMDFYAAEGGTVHPMPFRSMGAYPYPAGKSFPMDAAHLDYMLKYNTRHMSGNEQQGYAFDYPRANESSEHVH